MSSKISYRPAVREHRTERRETRAEVRDHRNEGKARVIDVLLEKAGRNRSDGYQPAPSRRPDGYQPAPSRRPDGYQPAPSRRPDGYQPAPSNRYDSGYQPAPSRRPVDLFPSMPQTQFPTINDPGFVPPLAGNGQYPVGDPGFSLPGTMERFPTINDPGFVPGGGNIDTSAAQAIRDLLRTPGEISGEKMLGAISRGVSDTDGHSTTTELEQFANFAKRYPDKLSAEAHTMMGIYKDFAKAAGPEGFTGAEFDKMLAEMGSVKDASAYHAMNRLDSVKGPISGEQLGNAILGAISDHDGKAASTELQQIQQWAKDNDARLSPAAKMALNAYVEIAGGAKARGAEGLTAGEVGQLRKKLGAAALADQLE